MEDRAFNHHKDIPNYGTMLMHDAQLAVGLDTLARQDLNILPKELFYPHNRNEEVKRSGLDAKYDSQGFLADVKFQLGGSMHEIKFDKGKLLSIHSPQPAFGDITLTYGNDEVIKSVELAQAGGGIKFELSPDEKLTRATVHVDHLFTTVLTNTPNEHSVRRTDAEGSETYEFDNQYRFQSGTERSNSGATFQINRDGSYTRR